MTHLLVHLSIPYFRPAEWEWLSRCTEKALCS